jgi:hypothetical protein
MRPLAKSAVIGTTISLSLTLALLSMIPLVIAILIWIMIPGFLLAWGASGMLHGTYADIFCLGKHTIARFGDDWERNLLLVRVAFPVEDA